ncbi:hypothetical protein GGR55DRAFT_619256 [Xylaria sp. FL0064]|nr:hypothetical protein GGR55DRAFT_619256 [Xylaria sp. FL0064]
MLASPGGQAASSSASAPSESTRKKRIACDNCHLSKVRCTGELSGCQRCERGQKSCHYSESNMGRTPPGGVRKQRRSNLHKAFDSFAAAAPDPALQRQNHDWDRVSPSTFESVGTGELLGDQQYALTRTMSRGENIDLPANDSMSKWDNYNGPPQQQNRQHQVKSVIDTTGSELDSLCFDPFVPTFDEIDFSDIDDGHFELIESSLDLAFPQLNVAQSSGTSPTTSQKDVEVQPQRQLQKTQLSSVSTSSTPQNSQHSCSEPRQASAMADSSVDCGVQFWTAQFETLSQTLQTPPILLDRMLHHSSQLLPRVREALPSLHSAKASSFTTTLILILVCLAQSITLFEQCVPSMLAECSMTNGSNSLSLRLGAFQVDRRAQQALQMHIVSQELSSMLQVLKIIRQMLVRSEWNSTSKRTHSLLLEDMRARTVRLVYQMKQRMAHIA